MTIILYIIKATFLLALFIALYELIRDEIKKLLK